VAWLAVLCLLMAACATPSRMPAAPETPSVREGGAGAADAGTGEAPAGATGTAGQGAAAPAATVSARQGAPPALLGRILFRGTSTLRTVVDGVTALSLDPRVDEVAVGSGDVLLSWQLDTHDARPYRDLLRTRGAEPAEVRTVLGSIQARFAAPPADRWEAWLEGVRGSHVTLVRRAEPTVILTYRAADGTLRLLAGEEAVVPDGPLWVRLAFDQEVDPASFAAWLADVEAQGEQPLIVTQEPGYRWAVELERAPACLTLDLRRVVAAGSGLPVARYPVTLRNEATLPYLERVSVDSGESEHLVTLPPEITEAWPSPDGDYIALRGRQSFQGEMRERRGGVVDLVRNQWLPLPLAAGSLRWAGGRLLNHPSAGEAAQAWEVWAPDAGERTAPPPFLTGAVPPTASFSPDGNRAAYLGGAEEDEPRGHGTSTAPLIVLDLTTGERQGAEAFVTAWPQGREALGPTAAWSPDGRRVAALDPMGPAGPSRLVIYDLERRGRQVVGEPVPVPATGARLAWSPDGRSLAVTAPGHTAWVIPLDGGPTIPIPDSGHGTAFWHGSGGRLLTARGPGEGVFVFDLADGSRFELGDGLPAGWDGDAVYVVRWPGTAARCGLR